MTRANLNTNGGQGATASLRRADADHGEGLGDPRAEAQHVHGRAQEGRPTVEGQEALDRWPHSGRVEQVTEHRVPVTTVVVAPSELVQVALKPRHGDAVVDATDRILRRSEEP